MFRSILLTFFLCSLLFSQIPNSEFENWANGNPVGWYTDNRSSQGFIAIERTTDAHSGTYALKAAVTNYKGETINPVLFIVFGYNERPANFTGYYKFNPVDGDSLVALTSFGGARDSNGMGGGGSITLKSTGNEYVQFNIPIYWASHYLPDSCVISFTLYPNQSGHLGTVYYLDDLSFSNNTASMKNNLPNSPKTFGLSQNYPNPFNPSTTIEYQIPMQSHVQLNVYDMLGNKVDELVNQNIVAGEYPINFNASKLSSGVYFYRIVASPINGQTRNFIQTKKFILLK